MKSDRKLHRPHINKGREVYLSLLFSILPLVFLRLEYLNVSSLIGNNSGATPASLESNDRPTAVDTCIYMRRSAST